MIVIVVVIMGVVISVISMNVSQTRLTEGQYQSLQSQLLASGEARRAAAEFQAGLTPSNTPYTVTVSGVPYTVSLRTTGGGLMGSSVVEVTVDY